MTASINSNSHLSLSQPSPWLKKWSHLLNANDSVLDIACGSGRHMHFLAQLGCELIGVDKDPAALESASRYGAVLQADLENEAWPVAIDKKFQVVIVFNYLHRPLFPRIQECIAQGGYLIYETFAVGNEEFGRPRSPEFLLLPNELLTQFKQLTPIAYEAGRLKQPDRIVQRAVFTRSYPPDTKSASTMPLLSLESLSY